MATSKVTFSEVQALYELCTSGTDIKDFCVQQGVNYQKFQTWRRKQLWNEQIGKTEEIIPSTLNAVEISNNLVEQRMKPIKLDLKNSQKIGSEDVAKRHAFIHSLIESCSMNKIPPYEYLVNLLEKYKTLTEEEKPALMLCYYKNNLKN